MGAPLRSDAGVTPIQLSLAIHYARRIITTGIKPIGRIPATIVGQIVVTTRHQHNAVALQPPVASMCSDLKVNITLIADRAMQTEALGGRAIISKDIHASRYFSIFFQKTSTF